MLSQGNFSQIYSQQDKIIRIDGCQLYELGGVYVQNIIIGIRNSLIQNYPLVQKHITYHMVISLSDLTSETKSHDKIGAGGNAQVFLSTYLSQSQNFALKTMENININMLEFYMQECINQYHLIQINRDYVLNFIELVYIKIANSHAAIYIPLELAEYSLFDYIQNNEITQEIYQYFYNLLIDMLILLHSNNYAHRDIKPQNILFIKGQGWKLADFGESIKYEKIQGLYKIQGTISFLPQEIRKQIHKNKEIIQNLFKNDIYAVMCTLVMLKNPKFKSKDLINYMDTQTFDQNVQQIQEILNQDYSAEQLQSIQFIKLDLNMELFKPNLKFIRQNVYYNLEDRLYYYYQIMCPLDEKMLIFIDNELKRRYEDINKDLYQKLTLYLLLFHPFQINQLQNYEFNQEIHTVTFEQSTLYFNSRFIFYMYLKYFRIDNILKHVIARAIKKQNQLLLLNIIDDFIRQGDLQIAEDLLEILGKFVLNDPNFNSELFLQYNSLYLRIHGQAPLIDENNILDSFFANNHQNNQNYFNLQQYLIQNKLFSEQRINLIILLQPLFFQEKLDMQTLTVIFQHIVSQLGLSELIISDDKLLLSYTVKQQLIIGGCSCYIEFMNKIILSVIKLFLYYDQFEGLLDLLFYFTSFIKYKNAFIQNQILSTIQKLILKLNFPIYHIVEDLNNFQSTIIPLKNKRYYNIYLGLIIQQNTNVLQSNLIQDQQKTKQKVYQINYEQIKLLLNEIMSRNAMSIYNNMDTFNIVKQFALVLGKIESKQQIYLSISILVIYKYLYGNGFDQNLVTSNKNTEKIKEQFDQILLKYFIYCKQLNRINQLFNLWKESNSPRQINNEMKKPLIDIILIKQNNLHLRNFNYQFTYLQQLFFFAINQKFRYLFDIKQHFYAAKISKSLKTRLKVHNICLTEQYLGLK